jgi:hypothetical protein
MRVGQTTYRLAPALLALALSACTALPFLAEPFEIDVKTIPVATPGSSSSPWSMGALSAASRRMFGREGRTPLSFPLPNEADWGLEVRNGDVTVLPGADLVEARERNMPAEIGRPTS